jgi:ribulose-phosphate 3-epimerase
MIIPAVLPTTIHDVERRVSIVADHIERFHIDVADGLFAPVQTWPIINRNGFQDIVNGDRSLPHAQKVKYEVHLMVQDPEEKIDEWLVTGVKSIIAHASMLQSPHLTRKKMQAAGVEFGVAVTPTEYQIVDDSLFELADFVLVMGSDKIGHHGVKLSNESVKIIEKLSKNLGIPIGIDIGVNKDTISELSRAGASRFVSGSAVFGSEEPKEALRILGA